MYKYIVVYTYIYMQQKLELSFMFHFKAQQINSLTIFLQTPDIDKQMSWPTTPFSCRFVLNQLSSIQNPYDIPLYWLVHRDPYIG